MVPLAGTGGASGPRVPRAAAFLLGSHVACGRPPPDSAQPSAGVDTVGSATASVRTLLMEGSMRRVIVFVCLAGFLSLLLAAPVLEVAGLAWTAEPGS